LFISARTTRDAGTSARRERFLRSTTLLVVAVVATQVSAAGAVACGWVGLPGAGAASFAWAGLAVVGVVMSCVVAVEAALGPARILVVLGSVLLLNAGTAVGLTATASTSLHVLYLSVLGQVRDGKVAGWAAGDGNLAAGTRFVDVTDLEGRPLSMTSRIDAAQLPTSLHPLVTTTVTPQDLRPGAPGSAVAGQSSGAAEPVLFWVDRLRVVNPLPAPAVSGTDLRTGAILFPLLFCLLAYCVLALLLHRVERASRGHADHSATFLVPPPAQPF
jgi:hypothetical protein